jgi:hypothetical protein
MFYGSRIRNKIKVLLGSGSTKNILLGIFLEQCHKTFLSVILILSNKLERFSIYATDTLVYYFQEPALRVVILKSVPG